MAEWWQRWITFGARGRVEARIQNYQGVVHQATALATQLEKKRAAANATLKRLILLKKAGLRDLEKIRQIAKNLNVKERRFNAEVVGCEVPAVAVARIETTLGGATTAVNAAKGLVTGTSTAMGAWALVTSFGTASTGTAISSLSGVALTDATLAWFGGGSLAAGGLGVGGGMVVIGGVVVGPVLVLIPLLLHAKANKEIAQIEAKSAELENMIDTMRKLELVADLAQQRAVELCRVIAKARDAFNAEFERMYQRLFRWGWFSRAWRSVRRLMIRSYFTRAEMKDLQFLLQAAAAFAEILDQRVFDADGNVDGGRS